MRVGQRGQDDPFRNLRTMDTGGGSQRDRGVCVDWGIGDVISPSGEKMDELEIWAGLWTRREGGEGDEYGSIFVNFCGGTWQSTIGLTISE